MNSDFTLCWSFKNRPKIFLNSLYSADRFFPRDVKFLLVDGGSDQDTLKDVRNACNRLDRECRIIEAGKNSLWEAWNYCLLFSDTRYVIYSSSDVFFLRSGCLEYIQEKVKEKFEYILCGNHAVFCLDKQAVAKIGFWDESFKNGPHADCDYMIRASESGVSLLCGENHWYIHGDSPEETIKRVSSEVEDRLPMNSFENEDYFKLKWGGNWTWRGQNTNNLPHPPTHISQVTRKLTEPQYNYLRKCL